MGNNRGKAPLCPALCYVELDTVLILHIGFRLWRHFPPIASSTVVVFKNNTRVLGRSGRAAEKERGKHYDHLVWATLKTIASTTFLDL
jgi:hypothetical protein